MQVQGLTDETYSALSLLSLRQQSLMKIATTLLSNHHHQLVDVMLKRRMMEKTEQGYGDWNGRWTNFKVVLSNEINQLHFPKRLNEDVREQVMYLLCSVLNFEYPQIFNPAIRFTPRGHLDVSRMFEDYVSARSFHDLPRKEKYDLCRGACSLYQDRCIQLILCDLLLWKRSRLEPFLRNAVCLVEVNSEGPWSFGGDISFQLEDTGDPAPWTSFVVTLNNKFRSRNYPDEIVFSFQQNVVTVSISTTLNNYLMFLWPKLTQFEKATYAEMFSQCALVVSDAYLLIEVMRFLDFPTRTRFLGRHVVAFILCFLQHPHDRSFVPDLQLQELPIEDSIHYIPRVMIYHIYDIFSEGTFCRSRRDCVVELWQYFSSRNTLLGDDVLRQFKKALEHVLRRNPWLRRESHTDDNKAFWEFCEPILKKLQ